jgi:hypothetical protein
LKIENSLESLISLDVFERAQRFFASTDTNFGQLLKLAGINPKTDLRHADLSHVDFSDSDLRGFDFTGCDLRGSIGVNVEWDDTTRLTDADVSDSLFAYVTDRKRFFQENPEHLEKVGMLVGEYWANAIVQVANMLHESEDRAASLQIARAVFEETKDPTVRSDILLHMGVANPSKEDHKAFIYHLLAKRGKDRTVLRPALSALRYQYLDDLDAFNAMLKFVTNPDPQVQLYALTGVMSSRHFFNALDEIHDLVLVSKNPMMRRAFVGRIARRELGQSAALLEDDAVVNFIDFREEVSNKKLIAMARRSFTKVKPSDVPRIEKRFGFVAELSIRDENQIRASLIRTILSATSQKYRIPFIVEEQSSVIKAIEKAQLITSR